MGLVRHLLSQGHEVVAIAPYDVYSDRLKFKGCSYVPCFMDNKGTSPLKDFNLFIRFFSIYKSIKPDIILHYTIKPNIYGNLAAASLGIPAISNISGLGTVFLHKRWSSNVAQWLYRFSLKFAGHVFFQNQDDLELFRERGLIQASKCSLLPGSGVDLKRFKQVQLPKGPPFRFLMASRLLFDKGVHHFAEAAIRLKGKGFEHEFVLQGFTDFESNAGIPKETLNTWENTGAIKIEPPTDDMEQSLSLAHVCVLPSYREGTPRVLLEAAAMGRPIITTDVPGCREVVLPHMNGLMCDPYSTNALERAIETMGAKTLDELATMGTASRKLVEAKFDEQYVFRAYDQVIKKLVKS